MEKIIFIAVAVSKVYGQNYYFDANRTSFNPSAEDYAVNEPITVYEFDEVVNYYRSDFRKREPQFLGFDIQDDNIEIDMEIAVPFLSVPTKKGLSKKRNFANVNVAAVILAGIVAVGGTLLGGAARFFRGDNFFDGRPFLRTGNKNQKHKRKKLIVALI